MFKIVDNAYASEIEVQVEALEEAGNEIEGVTLVHLVNKYNVSVEKYTAVIKYQPNPNIPSKNYYEDN